MTVEAARPGGGQYRTAFPVDVNFSLGALLAAHQTSFPSPEATETLHSIPNFSINSFSVSLSGM
jgi:hypothetical protein